MENIILQNLLLSEDYCRKVLPFLKSDYFHESGHKLLFLSIKNFFEKYNRLPTKETIIIDLNNDTRVNESLFNSVQEVLTELTDEKADSEWLVDISEKFCQDKAIYNAIMESIEIMDGKSKDKEKGAIPELLSQALAVCFDNSVGHDFVEDSNERFALYKLKEAKIEFDLELLNKITKGGFSRKTMNIFLAGTGVGKSLVMCHLAAHNLLLGKQVLYITMEMSEEKIAERIDANLLDIPLDDFEELPKDVYDKRINKLKSKGVGKLIIKEYPTGAANVNHFRHLLHELKIKKNFKPDIIYIDYLNICSSSRYKGGISNMYLYIKSVAEELRGLAVEYNVPIVSATQTNRTGYSNGDPGLDDVSDSFGIAFTVDFAASLITNEELEKRGQILFKQLKNRYADPSYFGKFVVGIEKRKMRLFDVEPSAQTGIVDEPDVPVFDNTKMTEEKKEKLKGLIV